MRIWKYVLTDNSVKKEHNRARFIAMIEPLLNQGSQFLKLIFKLKCITLSLITTLKIHTELYISKIPIFIQSFRKIIGAVSDKA